MGIRDTAADEARRMLQDDKIAILLGELIASGVRKAVRMCDGGTIDPNLLDGNTRATPVNVSGKFVMTPANPSAATLAAALLLAQANFQPGVYPPVGAPENFGADYQTGVVVGQGPTLVVPIRPSEILVVDTLGITTFSQIAEYELVWTLAYGFVAAAGDAPLDAGLQMIAARRGWPFGGVARPAMLHGKARFAPQQGTKRDPDAAVTLAVKDTAVVSATYNPAPHLVLVSLRGWKVNTGSNGSAESTVLGGAICNPEGKF